MSYTFALFAIIAASYLTLRKVCMMEESKVQSPVMIAALGFISWVFILSLAGWALLTLYLIYALTVLSAIGSIYSLVFIALLSGIAIKSNEALDTATVFHFLRSAAFFHPIRPKTLIFQEELDKKKIHDVHRQTSDQPFPTEGKQKRLLTEKEVQRFRQEAQSLSQRQLRSSRFDDEVRSLESGTPTSITDPWKIYAFTHKLHDWYDEMSDIRIDPRSSSLHFKINLLNATETALRDPIYVYRLKQDLYQLLQVLNSDPWLQCYGEYISRIVATCLGLESDSFGHKQLYPFLKIDIMRARLSELGEKFFNAADLHTISTLTFDNGKPLQEEST
jgi:hypothetical protein